MTINIEDLLRADLSEAIDSAAAPLPPLHPGEVLREEFLRPLGLSANAVATALRVPATRINDIVREHRGITADTALRLARYFGTTAQFWLNLQTEYDLQCASAAAGYSLEEQIQPYVRAA